LAGRLGPVQGLALLPRVLLPDRKLRVRPLLVQQAQALQLEVAEALARIALHYQHHRGLADQYPGHPETSCGGTSRSAQFCHPHQSRHLARHSVSCRQGTE